MLVKTEKSSLPSLSSEGLLSKIAKGFDLSSEEILGVVSILNTVRDVKKLEKFQSTFPAKSKDVIEGAGFIKSVNKSLSLKELPTVDEVYGFIKVLGKMKLYSQSDLIETFLSEEDSLTVLLVLEILCLDWKKTELYLEQVISFAIGCSFDQDGDIAETAIKILGEYLRDIKDDHDSTERVFQIKNLLVEILKDKESLSSSRKASYFSILRAHGREWAEIPSECLDFVFVENFTESEGLVEVDWSLVNNFLMNDSRQ